MVLTLECVVSSTASHDIHVASWCVDSTDIYLTLLRACIFQILAKCLKCGFYSGVTKGARHSIELVDCQIIYRYNIDSVYWFFQWRFCLCKCDLCRVFSQDWELFFLNMHLVFWISTCAIPFKIGSPELITLIKDMVKPFFGHLL